MSSRSSIWVLAALAFGAKLWLALHTYGTNDMLFYEAYWRKSLQPEGGIGLYRDGIVLSDNGVPYRHEPYMNPPFVIHVMRGAGLLSESTGLPFPFWMRLPSILADIGILVLLWRWNPGWPVALTAMSPVLILTSGFHGSTDSVMMLFLLLAIRLAGINYIVAGALFGMSLNINIWPLLLAPAILFWLADRRKAMRFSLAAGFVFAAGSTPWFWQDPPLIANRLLGYSSVAGVWGVGRLLSFVEWHLSYAVAGKAMLVVFMIWLGSALAKRIDLPLEHRCALLAVLFMILTPGFGVHYLAWVAPFIALLPVEAVLAFSLAGGVFLFSVYSYWSGPFPWIVASSIRRGSWTAMPIVHEILCWLVLIACLAVLLKRIQIRPGLKPLVQPAIKRKRMRLTVPALTSRSSGT